LGQTVAKAVNNALRTYSLDMLAENPPTDADAIREWIKGKVDSTLLIQDALPRGPEEAPVPDKETHPRASGHDGS
jgi:hypothetical protein